MKPIELYTTVGCPYSEAAREDLEWRGVDFVEYDVEKNQEACERMLELTGGNRHLRGRQARPGRVDGQRLHHLRGHPDNHRAASGAW